MYKRAGFTLIELLVVVLIIGILSAVALPQYTLVVEKARATEAMSILKTMESAMEVYALSSGGDQAAFNASSDRWGLLDIELPLSDAPRSNAVEYGLKKSKYFIYSLESPQYVRAYREMDGGKNDYDLFIDLTGTRWSFSKKGYHLCSANTAQGTKICKNLGTLLSGNKYLMR